MELPTLDGLLKEVGIPLALLDQRCSNEHLEKISLFLDWRALAPHLGLKPTEMGEIESKETDTERALATLQKWKKKYGYLAKFKKLVEILLNEGSADDAEQVCQLLQVQPQAHTEPNIENEIKELEDQFSKVVDKAQCDLEKSGLSMVKLCVTQLTASLKHNRKLLQENLPAIENAKSISEVLTIVSLYWNFLNYGLLKEIVHKLGNYETKRLMEKYAEKLREFRMKTKLEDFIGKWARSCPANFSEVVSEMGGEWNTSTLEDLEEVRIKLARTMYVEEYALHCTGIKSDPLSVTWALPSSLPGFTDTLQSIAPLVKEEYNVVVVLFQGKPIASPLDDHQKGERELLLELRKKPEDKPPTPKRPTNPLPQQCHEFDEEHGTFLTTSDCMFIASVGKKRPPGTRVESKPPDKDRAHRALKTHGRLPRTTIELPEGTEVDLVIVSRLWRDHRRKELVNLKLDIPGSERSRDYYLQEIEKFLKECKKPGATIWYTGRSEHRTGNWCFKDGTISFQEIFDLYRAHYSGNYLGIISDCCYSGKWVYTCAEMLDEMKIPPCGHKAREQGIMIKVFASCQPDQKAIDPCYSLAGVEFREEDQTTYFNDNKQLTEKQSSIKGDFNKLVCCKGPDDACPAKSEFKNWKWADAVIGKMSENIVLKRSIDRESQSWYYVLLYDEDRRVKFKAQALGTLNIADWGYVLESGPGKGPPRSIRDKISEWTGVTSSSK